MSSWPTSNCEASATRISTMWRRGVTPAFSKLVQETDGALRRVVSTAVMSGLPVPALSSALAYFDSYRRGRGTANLIQAQRDFFGAHGFDRVDGVDKHHGPWGSGLNA